MNPRSSQYAASTLDLMEMKAERRIGGIEREAVAVIVQQGEGRALSLRGALPNWSPERERSVLPGGPQPAGRNRQQSSSHLDRLG